MRGVACTLAVVVIGAVVPGLYATAAETAKIYTDDAGTAGARVFEIELSGSRNRRDLRFEETGVTGDRGDARTWLWELALAYGVTDTLDINLGFAWEDLKESDGEPKAGKGFGDSSVALKWNFGRLGRWDFSYVGGFTLPTGDEGDEGDLGPGSGLTTLDQLFVATLANERWTLSADAGFALPINENRHGERTSWLADVAAGWQVREPVQLLAELNYLRDDTENDGNTHLLGLTAGVTWQLNEVFRLDVGGSHGIAGDQASSTRAVRVNLLGAF